QDRRGAPLLLELVRALLRRRSTEVKCDTPLCHRCLNSVPVEHVVRAKVIVLTDGRSPRYFDRVTSAKRQTRGDRLFSKTNHEDARTIGKRREHFVEQTPRVHGCAQIAHVACKDGVELREVLAPSPRHRQSRLLTFSDLVSHFA